MDFQEICSTQIVWLLEGDPAIRYQTLRDLVNAQLATRQFQKRASSREKTGTKPYKVIDFDSKPVEISRTFRWFAPAKAVFAASVALEFRLNANCRVARMRKTKMFSKNDSEY